MNVRHVQTVDSNPNSRATHPCILRPTALCRMVLIIRDCTVVVSDLLFLAHRRVRAVIGRVVKFIIARTFLFAYYANNFIILIIQFKANISCTIIRNITTFS